MADLDFAALALPFLSAANNKDRTELLSCMAVAEAAARADKDAMLKALVEHSTLLERRLREQEVNTATVRNFCDASVAQHNQERRRLDSVLELYEQANAEAADKVRRLEERVANAEAEAGRQMRLKERAETEKEDLEFQLGAAVAAAEADAEYQKQLKEEAVEQEEAVAAQLNDATEEIEELRARNAEMFVELRKYRQEPERAPQGCAELGLCVCGNCFGEDDFGEDD